MKFKNVYYLKSCKKVSDFPQYLYPEFAFFGRSNVGKSSLINMLLNKKNLVKTGQKPGVTQMINFFVADDNLSVVDLPGYGYAKVPLEIKKAFLPMIKSYIMNRKNLRLAFLLIDIRRIPGDYESEILALLTGNRIPVAIVLTKCDKVSGNERSVNTAKILKQLEIGKEALFYSSTKSSEGKKELLKLMEDHRSL
ncbi:MAG: YihA family ribosome biogenesis GTP-binding protein [Spirochaetae bacterium HGW-Spirochaetae-1]|jgi:GTP-binding protein|nr:MAG: YihA family ribosome biogenesis GTP-binding protein [Spirochaetae bacterium HGW-Spirochaetae-1]